MSSDDLEPAHLEPSFFIKAFSIAGAFVAVGAVAALITYVLVDINKWQQYQYGIFGLAWGGCARLFELSVRRGIKQNLASVHITTERRKMLGEQLAMLRITRWFVRAELLATVILFLAEFVTR
jgi:hypothetical protein